MKEEVDILFQDALRKRGLDKCTSCGKVVDRGDVAWNNGSTEFGTEYSVIEIQCQRCDTEILHAESWYSDIRSFEELAKNFDEIIGE